ncbi:MAG: hypothetical protein ACJ74Y_11745 [Bryobacteraceae bacterium]
MLTRDDKGIVADFTARSIPAGFPHAFIATIRSRLPGPSISTDSRYPSNALYFSGAGWPLKPEKVHLSSGRPAGWILSASTWNCVLS